MPKSLRVDVVQGEGDFFGRYTPTAFHPTDNCIVASGIGVEKLTVIRCDSVEYKHFGDVALPLCDDICFTNSGNFFVVVGSREISFWKWQGPDWIGCVRRVANAPFQFETYCDFYTLPVDQDKVWILGTDQWVLWSAVSGKPLDSAVIAPKEQIVWAGHNNAGEPTVVTIDEYLVNHPQVTLSVICLSSQKIVGSIPFNQWVHVVVNLDGSYAVSQGNQGNRMSNL